MGGDHRYSPAQCSGILQRQNIPAVLLPLPVTKTVAVAVEMALLTALPTTMDGTARQPFLPQSPSSLRAPLSVKSTRRR